jgi:formiminoglutamase
MPSDFFPLFDLLIRRLDVRALGIYETSPPLDQDDRTSKLAALIAHRFISRAGRNV